MLKVECLKDLIYNTGRSCTKGTVYTCKEENYPSEGTVFKVLKIISETKNGCIIACEQEGVWENDSLFSQHFRLI